MVKDLPVSVLNVLSPYMDLLVGSVFNVSQADIDKTRMRVVDLEKALEIKKKEEREHLEMSAQIEVILQALHKECSNDIDEPLLNSIIMILESKHEYHLDQANRAHVRREHDRLRDARTQLRFLTTQRRLADAIAKRSDR